jgi:hypothetical protein
MHLHNLLSVHYRAVIYPNMDLRFLVMLLWLGCSIQKQSRESFYDDIDEEPEEIFHATFDNRHYRWSFSNMRGTFSEHSTYGFEWSRTNTNKWKTSSVRSSSEMWNYRTILGLSPTGPLKIEDVKDA